MPIDERKETLLTDEFRAFYALIVELKKRVGFRSVSAAEGSEVWQRLLSYLERSGLVAARAGGVQAANGRDARYVMASFADEVFLNLDWSGREGWKLNLLEGKLFDSHIAGERFFVLGWVFVLRRLFLLAFFRVRILGAILFVLGRLVVGRRPFRTFF